MSITWPSSKTGRDSRIDEKPARSSGFSWVIYISDHMSVPAWQSLWIWVFQLNRWADPSFITVDNTMDKSIHHISLSNVNIWLALLLPFLSCNCTEINTHARSPLYWPTDQCREPYEFVKSHQDKISGSSGGTACTWTFFEGKAPEELALAMQTRSWSRLTYPCSDRPCYWAKLRLSKATNSKCIHTK